MSEYAFLYRGRNPGATPEQQQKHFEKWAAWFKDMTAKGFIKHPGHPLDDSGKVLRGSPKTIHDGPFAEAKDLIAGFTLVEARDLATAADIAAGCPILEVGGSVEVRPLRQMSA